MAQRALVTSRQSSFIAWVAVATGATLFSLGLSAAAFGAFVLGACCAYRARRAVR